MSTFCDQQVGDRSIINGCISQDRQMSAVSPVSWIRVGGKICDFTIKSCTVYFYIFVFRLSDITVVYSLCLLVLTGITEVPSVGYSLFKNKKTRKPRKLSAVFRKVVE